MVILLLLVVTLLNCVLALLLFKLSHLVPIRSAIPDPLPLLMPVADELGDPTDSSDLKCYNDMIYYCKHLSKLLPFNVNCYLRFNFGKAIYHYDRWVKCVFYQGKIKFCTNEFKSKNDYASKHYPICDVYDA